MQDNEVWVIEKDNINIDDTFWNCQGEDRHHYIKLLDSDGNAILINGWKAIHSFIEALFEDDPIPRRQLKSLALSGETWFADDIKNFLTESKTKKFLMYGKKMVGWKNNIGIDILNVDNVTTHSPLIDDFFINALISQTKEVMDGSNYKYPYDVKITHEEIKSMKGKKLVPTINVIVCGMHKLMVRLYKKKVEVISQMRLLNNKSPCGYYSLRPPRLVIKGESLSYGKFVPAVRKCVDYILDSTYRLNMLDNLKYDHAQLVATNDDELTEAEIADLELDNYTKFNKIVGELKL